MLTLTYLSRDRFGSVIICLLSSNKQITLTRYHEFLCVLMTWIYVLRCVLTVNTVLRGFQNVVTLAGLILGLRPANERRRYKVTPSLIGWAQT